MNKVDLHFRPSKGNTFRELLDCSLRVSSKRPGDEFFERWNHGVLMMALFAFGMIFGVTIADGFTTDGWFEKYQATLAAAVAAGVALHAVSRAWRATKA